MLNINAIVAVTEEATSTLTLPFELRQRTRQRLRLDDGREAALSLPRGRVLRGGDRLRADTGEIIVVAAAIEEVSTAFSADPVQLARAAYHLGNRHVRIQAGSGWLRYSTDHVLDNMLVEMGLHIAHETAPFEPEAGAYRGDD